MPLGLLPLHLLDEQTLAAPAASITFTLGNYKVPAWARHLVVLYNAASADAVAFRNVTVRLNADVGNTYHRQGLSGTVAVVASARASSVANLLGPDVSGASVVGAYDGGMLVFPHYAGTTNHKAMLAIGGPSETRVAVHAGRWANASAIASLTLAPNLGSFATGAYFALAVVDERFRVAESLLAADGTVTFSGIPQTPGDLVMLGCCRTDRAGVGDGIRIALNGDVTDGNYRHQNMQGTGASAYAWAATDRMVLGNANSVVPGDTATAGAFGAFALALSAYAGFSQKTLRGTGGFHELSGPNSDIEAGSARWASTAAVTSIALTPSNGANFKAGSLFSLYRVPKRLIARTVLDTDQASVTFSGIPQTYAALHALVLARTDAAATSDGVKAEINGDATGGNYARQWLFGASTTLSAAQASDARSGDVAGDTAPAGAFGEFVMKLPAHAAGDRHKHRFGAGGAADTTVRVRSSRWKSTVGVTSLTFSPVSGTVFKAGSSFELWGVMTTTEIEAQLRRRDLLLKKRPQ